MSEIKNVTGTGGTGGIDPTSTDDSAQSPKGLRFREVARRLREKEIGEPAAGEQGSQPGANVPSGKLFHRAQGHAHNPQVTGTQGTGPQGTGPKLNTPADTFFQPGSSAPATPEATQGPSLRDLFGGGAVQSNPAAQAQFPSQYGNQFGGLAGAKFGGVTGAQAAQNFVPTFMGNTQNVDIITGTVSNLNNRYFATPETAEWLITQKLPQLGFAGATIISKPAGASGGPFVANAQELWIQLPDGTQMNAGQLAACYINNPEAQFPGLADQNVKANIQAEQRYQAGRPVSNS